MSGAKATESMGVSLKEAGCMVPGKILHVFDWPVCPGAAMLSYLKSVT